MITIIWYPRLSRWPATDFTEPYLLRQNWQSEGIKKINDKDNDDNWYPAETLT